MVRPVQAGALLEVVVGVVGTVDDAGLGFILGLAPHLVAAVDACGDEASIGQIHSAHPVTGRQRVLTEVLVPVDEPRHEHLLGHVNVDEQVDSLARRAPTACLEREIVALGDDFGVEY